MEVEYMSKEIVKIIPNCIDNKITIYGQLTQKKFMSSGFKKYVYSLAINDITI